MPLAALKLSRDLFGCEFHELPSFDSEIATHGNATAECEWNLPATELLEKLRSDECVNESVSDDDECEEPPHPIYSNAKAPECAIILREFSSQRGRADMLKQILDFEENLTSVSKSQARKQTTISDI